MSIQRNAHLAGSAVIAGSMTEIYRMTRKNAAMVEQTTPAARSLADAAGELNGLVSGFRTADQAGAARSRPGGGSRQAA